tara:strand:+ start:158 stop:274 length:117 start_codon:yes stop_codon:yes gene_type:complete
LTTYLSIPLVKLNDALELAGKAVIADKELLLAKLRAID